MSFCSKVLLALVAIAFVSVLADDITQTKGGAKVCVGSICPDGSVFHYYNCCGTLYSDCCFMLQTWVIVVLAVIGLLIIASVVGGVIRCVCCGR
jgi:hypothetical protein